jgi:hypothetical protein
MGDLPMQKRNGRAGQIPELLLQDLGSIVPVALIFGGIKRLRDKLDMVWLHASLPAPINQIGNLRGIRSLLL